LGCNFTCSSKQEMISCTDLDIAPSKILYNNPIKDSHYIKFARSQDVDFMVFDNETELYKIKLYHPYSQLLLKIKSKETKTSGQSGDPTGCDVGECKFLLEKAKFLDLKVVGVYFNIGAKCQETDLYDVSIKEAKSVFNIATDLGISMNILNVGGGFAGHEKESPIKFEDLARIINESVDKHFNDVADMRLIAEPCRLFVARSHTMVFNVIGKKKIIDNKETKFLYYMNEGVYGSFNCIIFDGQIPEVFPFNERKEKRYKSTIFGPTCDSMDTISKDTELPELVVGEWCFVENFGAFTQAAASTFNGFQKIASTYIMLY